jgi:hypothetical protein
MITWKETGYEQHKRHKNKLESDALNDELNGLIRRIYRVIQDNKPVLNNYIKHPGKH